MFWNKKKTVAAGSTSLPTRSPLASALEPRMMFDGAVAATVADTAITAADATQTQTADDNSQHASDAVTPPAATSDQRQEVVFIDTQVKNYQQLLSSLKPGTEVVLLDGSQNGLQQIADYLNGRTGIDAIHILSHGSAGTLHLGNLSLTGENLSQHSQLLADVGNALSGEGDILLYGCDIAANPTGMALINGLAAFTEADVMASGNATGSSSYGGDWILEQGTGAIEASTLGFSVDTLLALPNGLQNVTSSTTPGNFLPGFTLAANYPTVGTDRPAGIYLNITEGGYAGFTGRFTVSADAINVGTFDLTALSFNKFASFGNHSFTITGYKADGGTVTTTFTRAAAGDFSLGDYTSFTGITKFEIALKEDGGLFGVNTILLDSFSVANAAVPLHPSITSATYDASTGILSVIGTDMRAGDTINTSKLKLLGEGGAPYTLTSGNVTASSATGFSVALNVADRAAIGLIFNRNGASSTGGSIFGLSAAAGWDATQGAAADETGNVITVTNVPVPTISASTYDAATGTLTVSGSGFTQLSGASNDIIASKFTFTGQGGLTYTLTNTPNVEITSSTSFTLTLSATDRNALQGVLNRSGTSSTGGTTYNLAADEDWLAGADPALVIDDLTNGVTVTNANSAPVAGNDSYSLNEDSPLTGSSVLANDTDADGNTLTASLVSGPAHGTLTLNPNGTFSYTPAANFHGTDNFTYRAHDGQANSNVATVTLTINDVNDAPMLTTSGGGSTFTENGSAVVIDSGLTLSDVDNATLGLATVAITGNFASGQDVLAFVNDGSMGNISASYDAGTGVLTLTSAGASATLAQWQAALRSVTYSNGSDAPSTATRTISFRVNDGTADSNHATKMLNVTAVNDAPHITAPATLSVTEDQASVLTGISFSDPDSGANPVIAIFSVPSGMLTATSGGAVTVQGSGGSSLTLTGTLANVNAFIAGNKLSYTTAANATANVTLSIGINDGGSPNLNHSRTVALQVTAVNDAPVVSVPAYIGVTEDVSSVISGISFSDVDAGANTVTATFSVPSGTLSATNALGVNVGGSGTGLLTLTGALPDINFFIAAQNLTFRTAQNATANVVLSISINDGGNTGGGALTDSRTLTLIVTAVNDAPVNSLPAAQSVDQDASLVFSSGNGNLISISDVDAGAGILSVTLVASYGQLSLAGITGLTFSNGDGSNDGAMTFNGTLIDINNALNGLSYSPATGYNGPAILQISTSDLELSGSGGIRIDTDTIQITVNPINPVITAISSSNADGTYKVGDVITISTTFDQVVTVDTNGGIPSLLLETGLTDRIATYVSGSGSNTLTFSYTVQTGDSSADLDYASSSALSLNGGTIQDGTSQSANLTLPTPGAAGSLGANKALVVDGVRPTATSITLSDTALRIGETATVTITFSEAVSGLTSADFSVANGALSNLSSSDGGITWTATLTPGANVTAAGNLITLNNTGYSDAAGNTGSGSTNSNAYAIDTLRPSATSITLSDTALRIGETATVTITFSEAVSGLTSADFSVANGALSNLSSSDGGITWTATLTPGANVTAAGNLITLNNTGYSDAAGNTGSGSTNSNAYAIDTLRPSATLVVADSTLKAGQSTTVTITFNEAVTGLTTADFSVANGSLSNLTTSDNITWTATLTPDAYVTDATNLITLDNTGYTDAAGNTGTGTTDSNNYAIDTQVATVTSVTVPANGTYVAGQNLDFTVNFDEAVLVNTSNGIPRLAITLDTGGTVYASYLSGSGTSALVFRLSVTSGQLDSNGISLGSSIDTHGGTLRNATGNDSATTLNSVGSTTAVLIDAVAPQVSAISLDGTSPTSASSVSFTVTFSEGVSGVDLSDFSLATSGSVSATLQSLVQIDARTYRVTAGSISGVGSLGLNLNANGTFIVDGANNALASAFTGQAYSIDIPAVTPTPDVTGDPEFRISDPVTPPDLPSVPLQPQIFSPPTGDLGSPLTFAPLFEQRTLGGGMPPLGNIFISNGALAPSFIAQVFASSDSIGNGSGTGFLGFGGSDGGVFGSSTFAGIFSRDVPGVSEMSVFNGSQWAQSDLSQGLRGVFGAPTLGQQLHDLHEGKQRQVRELAQALEQFESTPTQA